MVRTLRRWRPSLRMARRDLRAHPLRTLVAVVLVAIPVAVAVVAATMTTTEDWLSDNSLRQQYGTADARLEVTERERARVEVQGADGSVYPEPVRRSAERDPATVDVAALLPPGSRVTRVGWASVTLATGGRLSAAIGDLDDPLTSGVLPELESGRAPTAPDEVALPRPVAEAVADDGTLELADGTALVVVGLLEGDDRWESTSALVPPDSRVADPAGGFDPDQDGYPTYLVDLPDLATPALQALQRDLADAGVGAWVRDSVEHRSAWGTPREVPEAVDPAAVAVGALVIGLGLVEVVVVVGAVFAVGARTQARVLGLLLASGATAADVRRTLLAQGLVIGLAASALGGLAAWAVLAFGRDPLGDVVGVRYLEWSVPVAGVVTTLLLGVLSAMVAAAVPAWGVGRMTASQALDGHVAVGVRARRHRTRTPGLWLAGLGAGGLALCGPWIAYSFRAGAGTESPVPVLLGGLSAIALLAGVGLLVPWLVTLAGALTARGWLPWRLAARDAARNRGRTVASVLAVGMVTTGAVFAGFAVTAQAATASSSGSTAPEDVIDVYLGPGQGDPASLDGLRSTLGDLVGATSVDSWGYARRDGRDLVSRQSLMVRVVDDAYLVSAGVDAAARSAFAEGAAVVAQAGLVREGEVVVRSGRGGRAERTTLPAVEASTDWGVFDAVWISAATAERIGATVEPSYSAWARVDGEVSRTDLDTLRLHGIDAWAEVPSADPDRRVYVAGALGALALTALVVGLVVALAASDSRADAATLAAVGAPPRLRRAVSAGHALFVGGLGGGLGLVLGTLGGATLLQVVAAPGTPVPWSGLLVLVLGVPLTCAVVGWLVAPTRLGLARRAG